MAQADLVRWGGLAAMGSGVLTLLYFLISLATGKGDEPGPLDLLDILSYLLQVVGLLGFHALQGRHYGRIGRAGLYITIGAIVVFVLLILTYLLFGDVGLEGLVPVGLLGMLVGLVLYGAATLQAGVLPRWCGILFIIAMPVGLLLGEYAAAIWGALVWVVLGYTLWSHSSSSGAVADRPSRVR